MRILFIFTFLLFTITNINSQQVTTLTGEINASGGISVDNDGNIYVADYGATLANSNGNTIYKIKPEGVIDTFATGFRGASGNAFDSQGNLLQSSINFNRQDISKITPMGEISLFSNHSNIGFPVGIAVWKDDTVFVANCTTLGSIARLSPDGLTSTIMAFGSPLNCPNGLTIDENGNLYTCNFGDGKVVKVTQNRDVSVLAEIPGGGNGHLTYANNRLYVVSRRGNQIYEVTLDGSVKLLAGTGETGNADGPALQATFNLPNGIDASPDGDTLYINDKTSADPNSLNPVVVRMITGVKSTVTDVQNSNNIPAEFYLSQNYPNPFNPSTLINYSIPNAVNVSIKVYDLLGSEIKTLVKEFKSPGSYSVEFDAGGLSSGVYIYRIRAGSFTKSKQMILVK